MTAPAAPVETARFAKRSDLRLRPIEEWDCLFVFTPAKPDLHILNTTSWAIMELCRGQDYGTLEDEYVDLIQATDRDKAREQLRDSLVFLERKGIVDRLDGGSTVHPATNGRR